MMHIITIKKTTPTTVNHLHLRHPPSFPPIKTFQPQLSKNINKPVTISTCAKLNLAPIKCSGSGNGNSQGDENVVKCMVVSIKWFFGFLLSGVKWFMKKVLKTYDTTEEKVVEMGTEVLLKEAITMAMEYVKKDSRVLFLCSVLKAAYDVLKPKKVG